MRGTRREKRIPQLTYSGGANHTDMVRHVAEEVQYDDLPGWRFELEEVSNNWYELKAVDEAGRSVESSGPDPDALLADARAWALRQS